MTGFFCYILCDTSPGIRELESIILLPRSEKTQARKLGEEVCSGLVHRPLLGPQRRDSCEKVNMVGQDTLKKCVHK